MRPEWPAFTRLASQYRTVLDRLDDRRPMMVIERQAKRSDFGVAMPSTTMLAAIMRRR